MDNMYRKKLEEATTNLDTTTRYEPIDYRTDFLLPADGLSFHWTKDDISNAHTHTFFEFALVTEGSYLHSINGKSNILPCGALVFIIPSDIHALYPQKTGTQINFAIAEEKLKDLCRLISPTFIDELIQCGGKGKYIVLAENDLQWFVDKANQITTHNPTNENHRYIHLLILEMLTCAISIVSRNRASFDYPQWFSDLILKVQQADWTTTKISDIYQWSHYSPSVINNYFKKYKGGTIISYVKKLKIRKARSLLLTTNFDILTISTMLGYESVSHFNRVFKFATGKTPGAFRKSSKK